MPIISYKYPTKDLCQMAQRYTQYKIMVDFELNRRALGTFDLRRYLVPLGEFMVPFNYQHRYHFFEGTPQHKGPKFNFETHKGHPPIK